MEKNSDNILNISNLPADIYHEIVTYLDISTLCFFATTHKYLLKQILPLLLERQKILLNNFNVKFVAGYENTYCYQANNLFACGSNRFGQLGTGNENAYCVLSTVLSLPVNINKLEVGANHVILLTENQKLWACGENGSGQLGLGHNQACLNFMEVPFSAKIKTIITGDYTTFVLTEDDKLWACGENGDGQLGLEDNDTCHELTAVPFTEKVKQVISKGNNTFVLTEDKQLWACGRNDYGVLGLEHSDACYELTPVPVPGKIKDLVVSRYHILVLTQDDKLWACGLNDRSQLGLGDGCDYCEELTLVPLPAIKIRQMAAGFSYSVILTEDDQLWGCGDLLSKADGDCSELFSMLPFPVPVKVKQIITSLDHFFLLTQDQQLWACGDNNFGQLGLGNDEAYCRLTVVPLSKKVKQVFVGRYHTLVLTDDLQLWGCGRNDFGQLGLGHNEKCFTFTFIKKLPVEIKKLFLDYQSIDALKRLGTFAQNRQVIDLVQPIPRQPDGQSFLKRMKLY